MTEMRLSHVIAGFVAVLVGYAGSVAIIYQATLAAGATPAQASSWMLALGLGCGISSIYLSLRHRVPMLTAWSTPGAALLVVALPGVPLEQAIGAFVGCGLLLLLTGLTGWFEKLNDWIPDALANAMLAGVLFRFGVEAFGSLQVDMVFAGTMIAVYVLARSFAARFAVPLLLIYGLGFAVMTGAFDLPAWQGAGIAMPVFIMPVFDVSVLISVGIPLYLVTMSSQNMAGVAVLRGAGYRAHVSSALNVTGFLTTVLAPFGGFAFNLAAITAAICANEEAGADPKTRYWAPVFSGLMYIVLGIFGAAVIGLFLAAPKVFVAVLAGLALLPTIAASLSASLATPAHREAALITFLTTVSGISFFGIAAPVWGLLFGAVAYGLTTLRR
ncbi:benzoate/H(+) symporter BenE family transporter [Cognatishimia sp.]|uniref:benzoate/H(+) symporter BenE family transporter n=1 Tax=Cognatishimia sp. TaxID=2211648 RepID=UPI0035148800|nr:benzoate/H(+) symporter BenE family transporter [Cognatishimia sp.]